MKQNKKLSLILYLMFLVFGIVLFSDPDRIMQYTSYILGAALLIVGAVKIVSYIKRTENGNVAISSFELIIGIVSIIGGLIAIFLPEFVRVALKIALGIWVLYDGIIKLMTAIVLSKSGFKSIWLSLSMAAISIAFGIFILFFPNFIPKTIGLLIIIYATLEIVDYIIMTLFGPKDNIDQPADIKIKTKAVTKTNNKEIIKMAKQKKDD